MLLPNSPRVVVVCLADRHSPTRTSGGAGRFPTVQTRRHSRTWNDTSSRPDRGCWQAALPCPVATWAYLRSKPVLLPRRTTPPSAPARRCSRSSSPSCLLTRKPCARSPFAPSSSSNLPASGPPARASGDADVRGFVARESLHQRLRPGALHQHQRFAHRLLANLRAMRLLDVVLLLLGCPGSRLGALKLRWRGPNDTSSQQRAEE